LADYAGLDHYEVLQVSPRADGDTIQRVFRFLAKRLHPDNPDTGNADRFKQLMESFRVLSDPEQRAAYDATYEEHRETRWRIFDQASVGDEVATDRRVRGSILQLFYAARRRDPDHPGLGVYDLERLLGCPEDHIKFHVWYLKENGWVQRLENGMLAITATGVDRALDDAVPPAAGQPRLRAVE
jgi:curved DNA-binding protein CbpA